MQHITEKLVVRKDGAVGWIVFNNPQRLNAVSFEMWQALPVALEEFAGDEAIRVVVLRGEGEKAFISGADISQFKERRSSAEAVLEYNAAADRANQALQQFAKPTIAGNAPLTIASIKRHLIEMLKEPAERDLALCQRIVDACYASEDYIEERTAFMEKRKPVFRGR